MYNRKHTSNRYFIFATLLCTVFICFFILSFKSNSAFEYLKKHSNSQNINLIYEDTLVEIPSCKIVFYNSEEYVSCAIVEKLSFTYGVRKISSKIPQYGSKGYLSLYSFFMVGNTQYRIDWGMVYQNIEEKVEIADQRAHIIRLSDGRCIFYLISDPFVNTSLSPEVALY